MRSGHSERSSALSGLHIHHGSTYDSMICKSLFFVFRLESQSQIDFWLPRQPISKYSNSVPTCPSHGCEQRIIFYKCLFKSSYHFKWSKNVKIALQMLESFDITHPMIIKIYHLIMRQSPFGCKLSGCENTECVDGWMLIGEVWGHRMLKNGYILRTWS